ncbi:MAG: hypothetical protein ABSE73_14895 [Planctomycetota bacterium]
MSQSDRPADKEAARTAKVRQPGGIEVLLKKAAVDPAFRQLLIEKRAGAAQAIGLKLEPAEALMLAQVPPAQLEGIISFTKVREMGPAAVCEGSPSRYVLVGGSRPNKPPTPADFEGMRVGGIRPDIPPQKPSAPESVQKESRLQIVPGGCRPDIPPQKPIARLLRAFSQLFHRRD